MSIEQNSEERNPPAELLNEEEFDIVSKGEVVGKSQGYRHSAFIALTLFLIALISFGIGKLVTYRKAEIPIHVTSEASASVSSATEKSAAVSEPATASKSSSIRTISKPTKLAPSTKSAKGLLGTVPTGPIVASKNGTKYYFVACSGAKRISEENKIYFATSSEAQKAGLSPAASCKGLK